MTVTAVSELSLVVAAGSTTLAVASPASVFWVKLAGHMILGSCESVGEQRRNEYDTCICQSVKSFSTNVRVQLHGTVLLEKPFN